MARTLERTPPVFRYNDAARRRQVSVVIGSDGSAAHSWRLPS
jgi:hypothetical protein